MAKIKVRKMVAALRDGFGHDVTTVKWTMEKGTNAWATVIVDGFDDAILVGAGGLEIPACFPVEIIAGIRLDCQAIHA